MVRREIIVNTISGRGEGKADLPGAEGLLRTLRIPFDLVCTDGGSVAAEILPQAIEVVCGGKD